MKLTRLRAIRERTPLSQRELAERAGISRAALIRIEAGASSPHPATIRALAAALDVEPCELMHSERIPNHLFTSALLDDEPLTLDDEAAIAEGEADISAGRVSPTEAEFELSSCD